MNPSYPIAIIGGTGVGEFPLDAAPESIVVSTHYGDAYATLGSLGGKPVAFLARHGVGHKLPPHKINYRANIAALVKLGVRAVFATTAVGGMHLQMRPGDFVLLDDFIDFTRDRENKTFFDGEGGVVVHTDFTRPYSDALRGVLIDAAHSLGIPLRPTGTYLAGDGPRYESPAEVRLFAQWGADVAGMTGVPETTLAREAGLHYAGISLVSNPGAGLSDTPLTHQEVEAAMRDAAPRLRQLLIEAVARLDAESLPPIGPGVPLPGV
jgi:5'-methylthioadenosine phosphorylase